MSRCRRFSTTVTTCVCEDRWDQRGRTGGEDEDERCLRARLLVHLVQVDGGRGEEGRPHRLVDEQPDGLREGGGTKTAEEEQALERRQPLPREHC